jgi:hypothetical protein
LQSVAWWRKNFLQHDTSYSDVEYEHKKIKARSKDFLLVKFNITPDHQFVTFFEPQFQRLKLSSMTDEKEISKLEDNAINSSKTNM